MLWGTFNELEVDSHTFILKFAYILLMQLTGSKGYRIVRAIFFIRTMALEILIGQAEQKNQCS